MRNGRMKRLNENKIKRKKGLNVSFFNHTLAWMPKNRIHANKDLDTKLRMM